MMFAESFARRADGRVPMKKAFFWMVAMILALSIAAPGLAYAEAATEAATEAPVVQGNSDWWNILLMGGDSRNKTSYDRTDSMIILSINLKENKAKMTSIMRDTLVGYPGMGSHGKINGANVYGGPTMAVATVRENFGIDINDYILINMTGLIGVVDQVGGIDIAVTPDEKKWTNYYADMYLRQTGSYDGETVLRETGDSVHLNGLLALSFCRNRYTGSDYDRTQRQRTVLLAALEKLKQGNAAQFMAVVATAVDSVETNLNYANILELANFGVNLDTSTIVQNRIPADGTFESGMKDGVWSIRPDFEKNKALLHAFIYEDAQQ
jgi:LCP family protein required for cell wall assembly